MIRPRVPYTNDPPYLNTSHISRHSKMEWDMSYTKSIFIHNYVFCELLSGPLFFNSLQEVGSNQL